MSTFDMKDVSKEVIWQDVGSGRNANTGKDNGVNQSTDRGLTSTSSPVLPDRENKSCFNILKIHSRKMNLMRGIHLKKIAENTNGASGAELKAPVILDPYSD